MKIPPKPATPGRAATSLCDQPYSHAAALAESSVRPVLFIFPNLKDGTIEPDLRWKGGVCHGSVGLVSLILESVVRSESRVTVQVAVWNHEGGYAIANATPAEAIRILDDESRSAWARMEAAA